MAGQTDYEAVQNYLDPLSRAISCITPAVLNNRGGYRASERPHTLTLSEDPVRLASNEIFFLSLTQYYRAIDVPGDADRGPWKVTIDGYEYSIDDAEGHEILAFPWHPATAPAFPHLHLSAGASIGRKGLQEAHIPTGRIAIESMIRLLIADFGVKALRDDWAEVLDDTQVRFEQYRTWG